MPLKAAKVEQKVKRFIALNTVAVKGVGVMIVLMQLREVLIFVLIMEEVVYAKLKVVHDHPKVLLVDASLTREEINA